MDFYRDLDKGLKLFWSLLAEDTSVTRINRQFLTGEESMEKKETRYSTNKKTAFDLVASLDIKIASQNRLWERSVSALTASVSGQ